MGMRTDLTAVPHASLRNPNPERPRKVLKNLEVCKRKWGQKLKAKADRQGDGVSRVTAAALALYQRLKIVRYKWLIRPLIHRNAIASLDWIGKSAPVPLLTKTIRIPVTTRVTHTHL